MKKILGLDLGTNSIGWALVEVDEYNTPIRIIALGARIIPLTSQDRDEFTKGQAISKNQNRTTTRTQRKGYDRKQLKKSDEFKYSLSKILKQLNIFPSEELLNLPKLDLWELRNKAASEPITPEQLGRILYMLNQKRGYKSVRSEANLDKKDTQYVADVKSRYTQLKDNNQTIGQYFYSELASSNQNNTYFRTKEKVYPREAYIEEFDTIINAQKESLNFLTDDIINKLRNEIIYYQRKLKSQKGLVGICEFEGFKKTIVDPETQLEKKIFVGSKVAPKTSPLFQLCKIWENVNNISFKVKNSEGSKYKWSDRVLTLEEKQKIADFLFHNENLSFADLLKILDLRKDDVYVNKQILKGIQGDITYSEIHKIIGDSDLLSFNTSIVPAQHNAILVDKKTGEILEEKESIQIDANIEKEPFYQLWHTIYSIKELDECKNALIKRFAFDETTADKLSKIDFNKQAFGNKSNKAMRKILPYLMQGYNYADACSFAGYNHSHSLTKDEQEQQQTQDKLDLLPKNSLRQPVVEKILNQMINVVNAIIENYGKPYEIRVELARELKQSKDERNDSTLHNTANEAINKEVEGRLNELGIKATKHFVEKYKLIYPIRTVIDGKTGKANSKKMKDAVVCNQCIYCGKTFSITEALTGDNFDVDHIVPKDLLPIDNSQTNKVLVHRSCNANKTNQTAYDYIAKKGEDELQRYLDRVDDWYKRGIISYGKMLRLKVSYEEYLERKKKGKETEADKKLWEDFLERDLKTTQYISRKATKILKQICNHVTVTEGTVTAQLRKLWGWDDVLMNLQLSKYKELEEKTEQKFTQIVEWESEHRRRKHQKEEIIGWTKRDDHRHHAIDALVIACTQQSFIQRINTFNSIDTKDEMKKEVDAAKNKYGKEYDENRLKETNETVKEYYGRLSQLEKYLIEKRPKTFTTAEVMKEANKILVSFKAGKKVATISKFKAVGKNESTGVITPRGALHEAGLYGKITTMKKGGIKEDCIIKKYKVGISAQDHIFTGKETYSVKKDKNGNEKIEDKIASVIDTIVDDKVKEIVLKRLNKGFGEGKDYGTDVKKALDNFRNLDENPLWYNEEKGIKIISIKMKTGLKENSVVPIRKNSNGKNITFVKTGNNHHIAIYEDTEGKLIEHSCTFWHAVERKKHKIPYIIKDTRELWNKLLDAELPQSFIEKLPNDNLKLKFSLQQNEMFILGMTDEQFTQAIENKDKALLSKYLYLVWSITEGDYFFRHHLETKNSELKKIKGTKESKRYYRLSTKGLFELNPIKVRINHLGEITKIGE